MESGTAERSVYLCSVGFRQSCWRTACGSFTAILPWSGAFVWQFADIRTCPAAGINRARGFNNKGILNEYRKPKLAYHAVRQCYLEFARAESETNGKGEMKP